MAGNLVTTPLGSWTLDWHQLTGSPGGWTVSAGTLVHAGSDTSGCASDAFAVTPGELLRVAATGSGSITAGARFRVAYGTGSFASGAVTSYVDLIDAGTFSSSGEEYASLLTVPAAVTHARLVVYNLAAGACVWSSVSARRLSTLTTPSLKVEVSFGRASNYANNGVLTWIVGAQNSDNRVGSSFLSPRGGSTADVAEWSDITTSVQSVAISRGRRSKTDTFETGSCTIVLDDPNRNYDPLNTNASATWVINGKTYIGTGRPLRVSFVDGDTAATYPIFTGRVNAWTPSPDLPIRATVQASENVTDLNSPIASTSYTSQRTDLLLGAILDTLGWPAALRRIDVGTVTAPAVTVAGSTLGTQRMCATVEHGRYYTDTDGSVRFRVGSSYRTLNVQATLDPASTVGAFGLDYEKASLLYDNDTLRNRVAGTRVDGTSADSQVAEDADSVASYGTHGYEATGLLFATNAEVAAWCEAVLASNAAPVARVDGIDIRPILNSAWWGLLMWADFGDRFTVKVNRFPIGSDVITQTVSLEAVSWKFQQLGALLDCEAHWSFVPTA